MKVYIVNVHEVEECTVKIHKAVVFTTMDEAKAYMQKYVDRADVIYSDWTEVERSEDCYVRYLDGYYSTDHIEVFITEQELNVP
jgi:uncharacterized protein YfcZ (UPF0381/DUF406 family)